MAIGDVVNAIGAVTTALVFQPAANTEYMISWTSATVGANAVTLFDGANTSVGNNQTVAVGNMTASLKFFINNTNYISIGASAGTRVGFTGLQIK